jgi:hypothetical protein
MVLRLTDARYVDAYRIRLTFDDGTQGVVGLAGGSWGEVFEPLRDVERFKAFRLDTELGTLTWPTRADLAPEFLYERASA